MSAARLALALAALTLVAACSPIVVKPWQREVLARPDMAWDTDPLVADYRRHAQFSKEAASGDTTPAGGGCGCN